MTLLVEKERLTYFKPWLRYGTAQNHTKSNQAGLTPFTRSSMLYREIHTNTHTHSYTERCRSNHFHHPARIMLDNTVCSRCGSIKGMRHTHDEIRKKWITE